MLAEWQGLSDASNAIYNKLSSAKQPSFFQLVQHPVQASNTLAKMLIYAGINNLRAAEARLSANSYDDQVTQLFEQDYEWEKEYHTILDGMFSSDPIDCRLIRRVLRQMGSYDGPNSRWILLLAAAHGQHVGAVSPTARFFPHSSPRKPMTTRVQSQKQALAGVMRVSPEGFAAAWYDDQIFVIASLN